jgi:hypothetical protein
MGRIGSCDAVCGGTLFGFTMDGPMEVARMRPVPAEVERAKLSMERRGE